MSYNPVKKICQNKDFSKYCEVEFIIEQEDFDFYEKIKVPPPTFCPTCRIQRRLSFRNQNKLFKNKSVFSDKDILSLVPSESNVPVVTQEEWFSDIWDPTDYAMDVDFSKPFLEQFFDLHLKIPQYNLNVARMFNSEYSGNAEEMKNCYMVFNATNNEDCLYGTGYYNSKNCSDNCDIYDSEFCYGNFLIENSSKVYFSEECRQCINVWFSKNCISCMNCVGCVNLRNKSFCIENIQYTKEEYLNKLSELDFRKYSNVLKYKNHTLSFWRSFPNKFIQGIKNIDSNGVYITQSKNVKNSYLVNGGENLRYVQFINEAPNKDSYDISVWGSNSELSYEYSSCGSGVYNSKFLVDCWPNIRDSEYLMRCRSSSNLFGCVGLHKKEFCILNKQYTKDEYFKMSEKIKQHMDNMPYIDSKGRVYKYGEFFPVEFSWYGYNNTLSQEFLPLTEDESKELGYKWYEVSQSDYIATLDSKNIPDSIFDVDESILKEVIQCKSCYKKYKIVNQEFEFLKRENLPIPRACPDCRYEERISRRLKPKLYKMKCMKDGCSNYFETGYNPADKNIVYCEECYKREIY
jgi:hypothetical protein